MPHKETTSRPKPYLSQEELTEDVRQLTSHSLQGEIPYTLFHQFRQRLEHTCNATVLGKSSGETSSDVMMLVMEMSRIVENSPEEEKMRVFSSFVKIRNKVNHLVGKAALQVKRRKVSSLLKPLGIRDVPNAIKILTILKKGLEVSRRRTQPLEKQEMILKQLVSLIDAVLFLAQQCGIDSRVHAPSLTSFLKSHYPRIIKIENKSEQISFLDSILSKSLSLFEKEFQALFDQRSAQKGEKQRVEAQQSKDVEVTSGIFTVSAPGSESPLMLSRLSDESSSEWTEKSVHEITTRTLKALKEIWTIVSQKKQQHLAEDLKFLYCLHKEHQCLRDLANEIIALSTANDTDTSMFEKLTDLIPEAVRVLRVQEDSTKAE